MISYVSSLWKKESLHETVERNANIEWWAVLAFDASKIYGDKFKDLGLQIYDESNKGIPFYDSQKHNASHTHANILTKKSRK